MAWGLGIMVHHSRRGIPAPQEHEREAPPLSAAALNWRIIMGADTDLDGTIDQPRIM